MKQHVFQCRKCGKTLGTTQEDIGKRTKCLSCNTIMIVPTRKEENAYIKKLEAEESARREREKEVERAMHRLQEAEAKIAQVEGKEVERKEKTEVLEEESQRQQEDEAEKSRPAEAKIKIVDVRKIEQIPEVAIVDIKMTFDSMIRFMIKWAIAAIPAMIILIILAVGAFLLVSMILAAWIV